MPNTKAIASRVLDKMAKQMEEEYREERRTAAVRLQHALADAIAEQGPTIETILYVLEVLRYQVLTQAMLLDEAPPGAPATPTPIGPHDHPEPAVEREEAQEEVEQEAPPAKATVLPRRPRSVAAM